MLGLNVYTTMHLKKFLMKAERKHVNFFFFLRIGFYYLKLVGKSPVSPEIQLSPPPSTRITSMCPAWALGINSDPVIGKQALY